MREAVKPDGWTYYEYLLVYVDDLLVASCDPSTIIQQVKSRFTLKDSSIGPPTRYLGATIKEFTIHSVDGSVRTWAMSAEEYLNNVLRNVEQKLEEADRRFPRKLPLYPMQPQYRPKMDDTPILDAVKVTTYQYLVGILRWLVEIGRLDIYYAASVLSQYLAAPRSGHLGQVLHIFAYLQGNPRSSIVFDPAYPEFEESRFDNVDWSDFYPDAKSMMPEPGVKSVSTTCSVDASHAGNKVTRRSHSNCLCEQSTNFMVLSPPEYRRGKFSWYRVYCIENQSRDCGVTQVLVADVRRTCRRGNQLVLRQSERGSQCNASQEPTEDASCEHLLSGCKRAMCDKSDMCCLVR